MGTWDGCHKIGRSSEPERRLGQVNNLIPAEVALVHAIRADDMAWLEKYLHTTFHHRRIRGEWFRLAADEIATIRSLTIVRGVGDLPPPLTQLHDHNQHRLLAEAGRNQTAGTRPFATEVTAELLDEFRGWLAGRPESVRDVQEWMLRQLLAKPPPPGSVPQVAARKRGRPKKVEEQEPPARTKKRSKK